MSHTHPCFLYSVYHFRDEISEGLRSELSKRDLKKKSDRGNEILVDWMFKMNGNSVKQKKLKYYKSII